MHVTKRVGSDRIQSWYEAWNRRDWQEVEQFVSPEFVGEDHVFGTSHEGRPGFLAHCHEYIRAFSDSRIRLERITGSSDGVMVIEYTQSGTQTGYFGLFPPSGRATTFHLCDILKIENGLIVSCRTYGDLYRPLAELQHVVSRAA